MEPEEIVRVLDSKSQFMEAFNLFANQLVSKKK